MEIGGLEMEGSGGGNPNTNFHFGSLWSHNGTDVRRTSRSRARRAGGRSTPGREKGEGGK